VPILIFYYRQNIIVFLRFCEFLLMSSYVFAKLNVLFSFACLNLVIIQSYCKSGHKNLHTWK